MSRPRKSSPTVPPVGARVKMRFGVDDVIATVTEHRGPLGVDGRHLVRVSFRLAEVDEPVETEVPIDEIERVTAA